MLIKLVFIFFSELETFSKTEVPDEQSNIFQKYSKTLLFKYATKQCQVLAMIEIILFHN